MKEPQMNADERRYNSAFEFSSIIHRKGRKERKVRRLTNLQPVWSEMKKILFLIEKDQKGGFNACALNYSIFTQGETIEEAKENIIDAMVCHFDDSLWWRQS